MEFSDEVSKAYQTIDRALDRELWIVTASDGTNRGGLVSTFVSQASIVPSMPRVLVGIARQHRTWELIESSGAFALHLLGEEHLDWVVRFGLQSGRSVDKFAGLETGIGFTESPILLGAAAWMDCIVESKLETGDRTVYLAEVIDTKANFAGPILTAHRMLELVSDSIRAQMLDDRTRDAAIDAQAINAWRNARAGH